ncbi:MAG: recombinase family protein [Rhodobacteraceae bacterium]|nr:MAG: recombinase family protein [Paracoccaceae bacterium]
MATTRVRCAIYTRKSSEEGLDQSFNSLDAQREACEAYIKSQASEGWRALPARYDDGGISGGTMDRPSLQRLLIDIERGRIDVVVVYKIDRLTRSLPDFSRMVEVFDRHDVSFVSVTQAFNTTSSMGRLTLNVLLSFAQFEREVTGERIRDKIAASKSKGMWMGGTVPLGYDLPADNTRALIINPDEARTVALIYRTYLDLGSVHALEHWLDARNIRSKRRVHRNGRVSGGKPFSRGALFHLLRNPIYLGRIPHKGELHEGLHEAIIDQSLYDAVQSRLDRQARRRKPGDPSAPQAPLTGYIFDATGERMSPTFATGANGKRYRYYVSSSLQKGMRLPDEGVLRRAPAGPLEQVIADRLRRTAGIDHADPYEQLARVEVHQGQISLFLPAALHQPLRATLCSDDTLTEDPQNPERVRLTMAFNLTCRGGASSMTPGTHPGPRPDPVLIRALRTAQDMLARDEAGRPIVTTSPASPYRRRLIRLAFLAPKIQAAILSGKQPAGMTLSKLISSEIPLSWDEQIRRFGPLIG